MPSQAGNKHLSIRFSPLRLYFFHVLTEKVRAQGVRNGPKSAYFRTGTIKISRNKDQMFFNKWKFRKIFMN